jgi:enoyl-CoA hydratase
MATVTTERSDNVLVVHIDDGKANALSKQMIGDIVAAVGVAEGDESISAVVLHGRDGKFSAGFDLGVMRGGDISAMVDLVADGGDLVRRLYGASVPIVAACTGHALAAGALMLLGCDVRIGADIDCKIGLNEVAIGMVLPDWAFTIAVDRLSKRHLQQSVATARITGASGAVDAGYLDELAPVDEVLTRAIERAQSFAGLDPRAYTGTVHKLRGDVLATMTDQIAADRTALG